MPESASCSSCSVTSALVFSNSPSVISTTRLSPPSSIARSCSTHDCWRPASLWNCAGDLLTLIWNAGWCKARQRLACAAACWNTQSPMSMMSPLDSAIGMNSAGLIRPRSGCCQRISASALWIAPLRRSTMGWYTTRNCCSAKPWRRSLARRTRFCAASCRAGVKKLKRLRPAPLAT